MFLNKLDKNSQIGDYYWNQLSMWDYSPKECVETFIRSECGKHIFHFVLKRMTERVSENHTRWEVVTSADGVPEEVLSWRNGQVKVKSI